jgi:hypothetical protein
MPSTILPAGAGRRFGRRPSRRCASTSAPTWQGYRVALATFVPRAFRTGTLTAAAPHSSQDIVLAMRSPLPSCRPTSDLQGSAHNGWALSYFRISCLPCFHG